jgi:dienelactone hydrolase
MTDDRNVKSQKWIEGMERFLQVSICFLAAFWLSSCATMRAANNPEELVRAFDRAIIAIPSKYLNQNDFSTSGGMLWGRVEDVRDELDKIPADSEIPLVIYMHGCAGIGMSALRDIGFLARNNYAVLAPDSFARKYKPKSCDPWTYTGGLHRGVLGFRLAEARYAHEVAKNLPWVDKRNISMMGFSEGGITTAKYPHGGLAGRIILGWTCTSGWPEYSGISGPRHEPILAVVASNDPWFTSPWTSGHCRSSLFFRRNLESIVVDVNFHAVQTLPEVQKKILQFLEVNKRPKSREFKSHQDQAISSKLMR